MIADLDVVSEKFTHDIIELLEVRYVIWNRYVIAKCIKETAESEKCELSHKNTFQHSKERNKVANENIDHITSEMDRIMQSCMAACSVVNSLIFETVSRKMEYAGKLNLNSLWKAGNSLDSRLGAVGIKSVEGEKLSDYASRLEIEIDGVLSTTTDATPTEIAIEEIRDKVGAETADPLAEMLMSDRRIEATLCSGLRDIHANWCLENTASDNEVGGDKDD